MFSMSEIVNLVKFKNQIGFNSTIIHSFLAHHATPLSLTLRRPHRCHFEHHCEHHCEHKPTLHTPRRPLTVPIAHVYAIAVSGSTTTTHRHWEHHHHTSSLRAPFGVEKVRIRFSCWFHYILMLLNPCYNNLCLNSSCLKQKNSSIGVWFLEGCEYERIQLVLNNNLKAKL